MKPEVGAGKRKGKTYPVLLQHIRVPLSQVITLLVVVHALDLLTFGEVFSNDASFHDLDPCLADVLSTSFQLRCVVLRHPGGEKQSRQRMREVTRVGGGGSGRWVG
jgi:hypothetical protein